VFLDKVDPGGRRLKEACASRSVLPQHRSGKHDRCRLIATIRAATQEKWLSRRKRLIVGFVSACVNTIAPATKQCKNQPAISCQSRDQPWPGCTSLRERQASCSRGRLSAAATHCSPLSAPKRTRIYTAHTMDARSASISPANFIWYGVGPVDAAFPRAFATSFGWPASCSLVSTSVSTRPLWLWLTAPLCEPVDAGQMYRPTPSLSVLAGGQSDRGMGGTCVAMATHTQTCNTSR
jgi:hypothetical protein